MNSQYTVPLIMLIITSIIQGFDIDGKYVHSIRNLLLNTICLTLLLYCITH